MSHRPLFSVIIPTYGRPQFLARAVESVQAQTIRDWECLVVVDGGEVPEVADDPRVRLVVRDSNGGAGAARNTGCAASVGRALAFLDDDDTWLPDRLELAMDGFASAPVVVCFGLAGDSLEWVGKWEGQVWDTILDIKAPSVNGVALKREVFVPFDESLRGAEDVEWLLRLSKRTTFTTVGRPGFVRGNADTERPDALPRLDGVEDLLEKHADYFSSHRRAAARCWKYYGETSYRVGRTSQARRGYLNAFLAQPSWSSLVLLMAATVRPVPSARRSR